MGRKKKEALDQLTLDALTEWALGMSYGKYKAQQYMKEREVRENQERLVAEAKKRRKEREQEKSNRLENKKSGAD